MVLSVAWINFIHFRIDRLCLYVGCLLKSSMGEYLYIESNLSTHGILWKSFYGLLSLSDMPHMNMKYRRKYELDCAACWPFIYLLKQMDWERGTDLGENWKESSPEANHNIEAKMSGGSGCMLASSKGFASPFLNPAHMWKRKRSSSLLNAINWTWL